MVCEIKCKCGACLVYDEELLFWWCRRCGFRLHEVSVLKT
jgi:C4-type Zn-finger protein